MLFGSISYLNLLPFQVFLKRYISNSAAKMTFEKKRAVPSVINRAFEHKNIHAAFISSITSSKYTCTNIGIVAYKKVYSVLLIEGTYQADPASATSNQLAKILNLQGEVLIGDVALKHYLDGGGGIDLAQAWHKKTGLPFVFARLCYNRHGNSVQKLARTFASKQTKIPQYILKREAKKRGIKPKELIWYLKHISYTLDWKSKRGLKRFLQKV